MNPFYFSQGSLPLLVSIPHAGTELPPEVDAGLSEAARGLPDTDWHIPLLYDFVRDLGASVLIVRPIISHSIPLPPPACSRKPCSTARQPLHQAKRPMPQRVRATSSRSGNLTISRFSRSWRGLKRSTAMRCCLTRIPSPVKSPACLRGGCPISTSAPTMARAARLK